MQTIFKSFISLCFSPKGEIKRGLFFLTTLIASLILIMAAKTCGLVNFTEELKNIVNNSNINIKGFCIFIIYNTTLIFYCYIMFCLFCKRFRNMGISLKWLIVVYLNTLVVMEWQSIKEPFLFSIMITSIIFSIIPSNIPDLSVEPTTSNYFLKHWRGEHSLIRSWFINSWAVSLIATLLNKCADVIIEKSQFSLNSIRIYTFVLITMMVINIWFSIGCWRSAANHKKLTNRKFWATIAQMLMIFSIIYLWIAFKQVMEFIKISTKTDQFSEYNIQVLNEEEIVLSGYMAFGIDKDIRKILDNNKNIRFIQLNSAGGRIGPARNLAKLIEERNLITYTTGCHSACLYPFMAGRQRIIQENAKLGFHMYTPIPGTDIYQFKKIIDADKVYFESKGISKAFIDKAFSTPSKELWFPTTKELIDNNVITHVINNYDR